MILIFGGGGFIGQHVSRALVRRGEEVIVTAHSRREPPALLADDIDAGRVRLEQVDVADEGAVSAVVARHRPRRIVDLTGMHPKAVAPAQDVRFRMSALTNILEAARIHHVARTVLMSSMDAYWGLGNDQVPFTEDMPVPLLEQDDHFIVQSWAKKALEIVGNLYRRQSGMDVVFVRGSGVYGPLYRTLMNVPSRIAHAAAGGHVTVAAEGAALPFAEDGYDQVYVEDMAEGIASVVTASTLRHPVYNIGSGAAPTYGAFAAAARDAVPGFLLTLPSRADTAGAAIPRSPMEGRWMDVARAREELGYAPRFSVGEAMARYIAWLRTHSR